MKVSILVPIYGVENYIGECVRSLMEQTYEDLEYIFVNDCSPDSSIAKLQETIGEYPSRQAQVKIVHHAVNRGLGAARLTAMQHATGDCLMHVDSDDLIPPYAVTALVKKMEQTGADVVDGGYAHYEQGNVTNTFKPFKGPTEHYLKRMLCHNVESNRIWGRLYRRSLFEEHDIYPIEGIDYGEDLALVSRLLYFARRATTDEVCYYYRMDNRTSYSHTISEKANTSFLRANRLIFDFFNAAPDARQYQVALRMGYVDLYRHARRFRLSMDNLDEMGDFWRKCFGTRLCVRLYRQKGCYRLANFCYLNSRRIYLVCLRLFYVFRQPR